MRASPARTQTNDVTDTSGIEHTPSHARGVRVSALPIGAYGNWLYIYGLHDKAVNRVLRVSITPELQGGRSQYSAPTYTIIQ